jgi:hypothetical protein
VPCAQSVSGYPHASSRAHRILDCIEKHPAEKRLFHEASNASFIDTAEEALRRCLDQENDGDGAAGKKPTIAAFDNALEHTLIEQKAAWHLSRSKSGKHAELVAQPRLKAFELKRETQRISENSISCSDEDDSSLRHASSPRERHTLHLHSETRLSEREDDALSYVKRR